MKQHLLHGATKKRHGEDFLSDVRAIEVTLESGKAASFNLADEIGAIPDAADEIRDLALRIDARLAFWGHQAERALHRVRRQRRKYEKTSGSYYIAYQSALERREPGRFTAAALVSSRVAIDKAVRREKVLLDAEENRYGVLRSLVEALTHRCHLLRRLLAQESENSRSG